MQYHEFLRKSGFTMEEVSYTAFHYYIEKAYMERDEMFPDQESIINYLKAAGIVGALPYILDKVDAVRRAIIDLNQCASKENFGALLELALNTAKTSSVS